MAYLLNDSPTQHFLKQIKDVFNLRVIKKVWTLSLYNQNSVHFI